jgi:nicotinate-nucleotide adenylyltransferase
LLRLALASDTTAGVDDREVRRGGISFSVDTVRAYAKEFPGAELFYLIGADQTAQLHLWREAPELARLAQFLIIPRPGELIAELVAPFRGRALRGFPLGVSSSDIRRRIKDALPVQHLMPPAVAEAVRNNRLYL